MKGSNIEIQHCLHSFFFFCLQLMLTAIRRDLRDGHITANQTLTKHLSLMHERLFDPRQTFTAESCNHSASDDTTQYHSITLKESTICLRSDQP